jgi:hypothetical protein
MWLAFHSNAWGQAERSDACINGGDGVEDVN